MIKAGESNKKFDLSKNDLYTELYKFIHEAMFSDNNVSKIVDDMEKLIITVITNFKKYENKD